ncbi:MAG: hypothetical protein ICV69_15865 [Thermoleophilaceae bacterium]|nr:hypothetical protein [Thermoleophilaceae bacterium]
MDVVVMLPSSGTRLTSDGFCAAGATSSILRWPRTIATTFASKGVGVWASPRVT